MTIDQLIQRVQDGNPVSEEVDRFLRETTTIRGGLASYPVALGAKVARSGSSKEVKRERIQQHLSDLQSQLKKPSLQPDEETDIRRQIKQLKSHL